MHQTKTPMSRRRFLALGGAVAITALGAGTLQLVLPELRTPAWAATRKTIPAAYKTRMPSNDALMTLSKKTLSKVTWKGVTGKKVTSSTEPSVDLYVFNKGSATAKCVRTNFLTMEFSNIGTIAGRKLNATVNFDRIEIGARIGSTTTGEDAKGNYTSVVLLGENILSVGATYTSGSTGYGYGFRAARTTKATMQVTWADTGKAVELPFFAAISDIDAPRAGTTDWFTEAWTADAGFTGDFWTWPDCYLVHSGTTFKSPKTELTDGNDRWFKSGVIAPLTGNSMTCTFAGGTCGTNLTLYSSYAGLKPPVKQVEERTYVANETVTFTVTQKMGCFFEDTMDYYTSLVLQDVIPPELDFRKATLHDGDGTDLTQQGSMDFDHETNTLRFEFKKDWLSNVANYRGQDLILTITCRANWPDGLEATATNRATTYFSGYAYESNEVQVRIIAECWVQVTKRIRAADVNWAHGNPTFVFTLSGTDHKGVKRSYSDSVTFQESDKAAGDWLEQETWMNAVPGTYLLTEEPCLRYQVESVTGNGTVKGNGMEFDLLKLVEGSAVFTNAKVCESGLTDVVTVRNRIGGPE